MIGGAAYDAPLACAGATEDGLAEETGIDSVGLWLLVVTLAGAGVILIVIGRKQASETLRRNWIAGLRTSETMQSDEAWFAAHTATAGFVTAAGVVQLAGAIGLLLLLRPDEDAGAAFVLIPATVTLVLVVVAGVRGHRIAERVNRGEHRP